MSYPQIADYQIGLGNQILLRKDKVVPLETVKNLVNCFDIEMKDVSIIVEFIENLKSQKVFFKKNKKKFDLLTPKEVEIFLLVSEGLSTKDIAEKIFIEASTVSTHRKHIKQKLEIDSQHDWFMYAIIYKNTYM